MGRLPFDPHKMSVARRQAASASPAEGGVANGAGAERISVSQLAARIESTLRDGLPRNLRVVGEISGFKERTHWYFDLKDAGAVISCVMWESAARKCAYVPESGQEVVVTGRVEFWGKGGRTQFYVEKLEPVGAGALDLAFRRLCDELQGLGWFSPERKRPLPAFPRRVAVVTSRTGAALQDVLDTMRRRCAAVEIVLLDVRVQGDGAAGEVARALGWVGRWHRELGVDAVILTRGGGSKEDLWAFNERAVAEAVVNCPVPVVAAIGHETDTSIAELVADERAATPTQAAMRLTPDTAALREQLDALGSRLHATVRGVVRHERERLRSAARHPFFCNPRLTLDASTERLAEAARRFRAAQRARLAELRERVERASARLERHRPTALLARRGSAVRAAEVRLLAAVETRVRCADLDPASRRLAAALSRAIERSRADLDGVDRSLELVGPVSVLRRGFSVTQRADGSTVRSVSEVAAGEPIRTRLADGVISSVVAGEGEAAALRVAANGSVPARVRRSRPGRGGRAAGKAGGSKDQLDLFGGAG